MTSKIYDPVVAELMQSGRTSRLIQVDLPQTGASTFSGQKTSWSSQRAVLREYLSSKSNYILVVHDISGPIALPLVPELKGLRGVVVLNTIIEASKFKPPFPMNVYRRPIAGRPKYPDRSKGVGIADEDK